MRRLLCWIIGHKWEPRTSDFAGNMKVRTHYVCARCDAQQTRDAFHLPP